VPQPPDTRETLIQRLPNAADVEAWNAFVEIYEPLLFRLARGRGLQGADAEDLVQEVLAAVAKSVHRWVADESRGPFRAWLFRIASNLAVNFLTRPKHRRLGTGGNQTARLLEEQPARAGRSSEFFLQEYRRELFRWAAERVREQVSEKQWMAFWLTSVEDRSISDVAQQLAMSAGSVYIARSRVTTRIRQMTREYEKQME
jgi:RNA polymerase sigma-70 factor (ECF subfamily)